MDWVPRLGYSLAVVGASSKTRSTFTPTTASEYASRGTRLARTAATMSTEHTLTLRVRYPECDPMGYLHHSIFLQYLEMGRIEALRAMGHSYADLERQGVFFVVVKAQVNYRSPAKYDELLTLTTRLMRQTHVRCDHSYELRRDKTLLADGTTTIAKEEPPDKLTVVQTLKTERGARTMAIDPSVKLTDDSTARVTSEGLLGSTFIALEPGGSETMLADGGQITNTQGAVDIWTLISQAMFEGKGKGGEGGTGAEA